MAKLNLGVLVSGSGSNLQAILDAVSAGTLDADVRVVISNIPGVKALERAERAGVPTRTLAHRDYSDRLAFEQALVDELARFGVQWVALAGFMRVLRGPMLHAFEGRLVNIHPALLPSFPGTHGQRQALQYGAKVSGCTVHFVDEGVDSGPIIAQRAVPVLDDDDEASLGARILEQEHALFVEVLRWIAADRVRIERHDGARSRVRVLPA